MAITLYFDQNVSRAIVNGLRLNEVDVMTAYEDGRAKWDDVALLERATQLGRVFVTHDRDFLREAARRRREGIYFSGVIFAQMEQALVSVYIRDLQIVAKVAELSELENQVIFLPL